eukprot:gene7302-418_t
MICRQDNDSDSEAVMTDARKQVEARMEVSILYPSEAAQCNGVDAVGPAGPVHKGREWADALKHELNSVDDSTVDSCSAPSVGTFHDAMQMGATLIRIDHMHNRSMYTRFIKGAASDLGLTGV